MTTLKSGNELWSSKMASISDLTPRELEILQLVIAGKTSKAIASELYISEKTVEFHLENIYTKLGVRTRMMTGIWAIQHSLQIELG
jgi:DNA-binding NarL/FixJ family response regulator